ncbi:hypothetical protein TNCV_2136461 [Trichonephila clavipes]|nr:hypothetical protein TNCV_2136461 [Trichonephila clavipes]
MVMVTSLCPVLNLSSLLPQKTRWEKHDTVVKNQSPSRRDDAEAWGVSWQLRYCPRHFVVQKDNVLASIHRVASERERS